MTTTIVPTTLNIMNYEDWSSRVKTYLLAEDLWDIVEGSYIKEGGETVNEAWQKKNAKALYAIQSSCKDETFKFIKDKTTAKEAWDTLFKFLKPRHNQQFGRKNVRSLVEAYPTEINVRPELAMEEGHDGVQETFAKYVESNDWDNAINFLRQNSNAASASVSLDGGTALHYAIRKRCGVRILQQLVNLMAVEHLEILDTHDYTALHFLIRNDPERVEVAECMVKKNDNLLTIWKKEPLVVVAQGKTKGEKMALYLYSLTPHKALNVSDAAQLISLGFRLQRFDIAWDLIQRFPKLAVAEDYNGDFPLVTLASNTSAFLIGYQLDRLEKLIYDCIRITPLPFIDKDSHVDVEGHESAQKHLNSSDWKYKAEMGRSRIPYVRHYSLMKFMHVRVPQFLPLMCEAASANMSDDQRTKLEESLCVATERGHVEYVYHLLTSAPYLVDSIRNEKGQNLLQIAVECRHYDVFKLIYTFICGLDGEDKYGQDPCDRIRDVVGTTDYCGNNMLHTVASITPLSKIDCIPIALQMKAELRWFKEVESIADPKDCESVNIYNMTPQEVFTKNHKEMMKEAEKSMKEIATSFTVVGALVATMMFAAIFTIPGGYDGKTGLPMFLTKKVFTRFIISDAISLFASATTVLLFLRISTSRYSRDDFCKDLPIIMIMGIFTLLVSIVCMMIAFSCALYIIIDGQRKMITYIIYLAILSVYHFVFLQIPFILDTIYPPTFKYSKKFGKNRKTPM